MEHKPKFVEGAYIVDTDIAKCWRCMTEHEFNNGTPIFFDMECDYQVHCEECGEALDHNLTREAKFTVVTASAGCLPDSEPLEFNTLEEALEALKEEFETYNEDEEEAPIMDSDGKGFTHPGEFNCYRTYIESPDR